MASFSCGFKYSDDHEVILDTPESSTGSEAKVIRGGETDMKIINSETVTNWQTELDVSMELMGSFRVGEDNSRLGVDVVVIVDVSSSMMESRGCLKSIMEFFTRKLDPTDRLSVVRFSNSAQRLCPLRCMTEDAQADIEKMTECLEVGVEGGANLAAGLGEALQVLKDRSYFKGRKSALIILSSSEATYDAAEVPLGDVPVHAFAIRSDFAHNVLKQIGSRSNGGTFSILNFEKTDSMSNLSHMFFSQCLARLLTVVIEYLKLTVAPLEDKYESKNELDEVEIESTIKKVNAKHHPERKSNATYSIIFSRRHQYRKERCEISVKLLIPKVDAQVETEVLRLICSDCHIEEPYNGVPAVEIMRILPPGEEPLKSMDPYTCPAPARLARNTGDAVKNFIANKDKFKSIHNIDKNANNECIHNIDNNVNDIPENANNDSIHSIGKATT